MLWYASSSHHARTHILHGDLNTAINIRKRSVLQEHLWALCPANIQRNHKVLCSGVDLKRWSLATKKSLATSERPGCSASARHCWGTARNAGSLERRMWPCWERPPMQVKID